VQTKEWLNAELKGIFPYSLGDDIRTISKQTKLSVGSSEALLLQMQPHFVAHLEVVWHPMLIMSLLVLSIGSIQDVMNLLLVRGILQLESLAFRSACIDLHFSFSLWRHLLY
jgi:hypothetical protein